jgi:hypothetical protein
MGKYDSYNYQKRSDDPKKKEIHPIWRGIGFFMLVITPLLAYAATEMILQANVENKWFSIPSELYLSGQYPLLLVKAIMILVLSFIIYLILTLFSMVLLKILSPSQYGPLDVPGQPYKGKKYKR